MMVEMMVDHLVASKVDWMVGLLVECLAYLSVDWRVYS